MTYDEWKLASAEEGVDLGDWESDATTAVEELCVHGEHPIECSLCTSAGFIAAVSGEEERVLTLGPNPGEWSECDYCGAMYPSGSHCLNCVAADGGEEETVTEDKKKQTFEFEIHLMETNDLVSLRYRIENELKKRVEIHEREAKAAQAALDGIKPRKQRSDAGTTRPRKTEAA